MVVVVVVVTQYTSSFRWWKTCHFLIIIYARCWAVMFRVCLCRFLNTWMLYVTDHLLNVWEWKQWKRCCWQAGVQVLLDITACHVSMLSREDLNAVEDLLWLFFCQKLINIRNDCCHVSYTLVLNNCCMMFWLFTVLIHCRQLNHDEIEFGKHTSRMLFLHPFVK